MQQDDFERILRETLQQDVTREKACLDGLEERIVGELDGHLPRLQFGDWLRQLLAPTRTARIGQLAIVGATAALFLILGAFIAGRTSLLPSAQPKEPSLEVASCWAISIPVASKYSGVLLSLTGAASPSTKNRLDGVRKSE